MGGVEEMLSQHASILHRIGQTSPFWQAWVRFYTDLGSKNVGILKGLVIVRRAHDSPYLEQNYPEYLNDHPWDILRRPHQNIYYVTISESRRRRFNELFGDLLCRHSPFLDT